MEKRKQEEARNSQKDNIFQIIGLLWFLPYDVFNSKNGLEMA